MELELLDKAALVVLALHLLFLEVRLLTLVAEAALAVNRAAQAALVDQAAAERATSSAVRRAVVMR